MLCLRNDTRNKSKDFSSVKGINALYDTEGCSAFLGDWKQRHGQSGHISGSRSGSGSGSASISITTGDPSNQGGTCSIEAPRALYTILSQVMTRQLKKDIRSIPKPHKIIVKLTMNSIEMHSYNAIVALAMVNLVTTGLDYQWRNGSHPDSLLNSRNS